MFFAKTTLQNVHDVFSLCFLQVKRYRVCRRNLPFKRNRFLPFYFSRSVRVFRFIRLVVRKTCKFIFPKKNTTNAFDTFPGCAYWILDGDGTVKRVVHGGGDSMASPRGKKIINALCFINLNKVRNERPSKISVPGNQRSCLISVENLVYYLYYFSFSASNHFLFLLLHY